MTPRLSLSLLGPLEVQLDGEPLGGFEYNKVRALLAYLAVEARQSHTRASLCALLWPDLSESAARQNLSQALTQLRKVLGDKRAATPFLLTTTERVQLNPEAPWDVDVTRFTALAAEAEAHAHRAWPLCTPCAAKLREVAALYRGDFLAQFYVSDSAPFEEWALLLRERLRQRLLSALERLAHYAEWREAYAQAAEIARRHVELEPLRDGSQRELMRLLALSGQQAAALAQYEYFQRTLATELDAEPEPETSALYEQIRTSDELDALRRIRSPLSHLPAPPTPLIGRAAHVQAVCERLQTGARLVTLTGAPGIGKTRLALEVAARLRFDFEDSVHFVELAPVQDPAQVASAVAQVLGVKEGAGQTLPDAVRAHLRPRHTLLALDNFEHVLDAAPFVADLLAACPALSVLITSRAPLRLRAERQYPLDPLTLPAEHADAHAALQAESVQLFVDRAQAVRIGFAVTAENTTLVTAICRRMDGLPLAIELIAPRLRSLSVAEVHHQLESPLASLATGLRDLPARHRTLRDAIQWSYARLRAAEQRVFAHLGVFVGGCTAEAVQAVLNEAALALPALEALTEASLVHAQTIAGETRFTLLETLREFALEQLAARGERDAAQQRHAAYIQQLAEAAYEQLLGPDQAHWSARLAVELDNVRAALCWAGQHRMIETSLRIATGVFRFCWQRGLLREGLSWFEPAFSCRHTAPLDVQSRAFRAAGVLALGLNDYPRAREWMEEAIAAGRQAGDAYLVAAATTNLGLVLKDQGEWESASARLAEAITLNRALEGKPHAVKFALVILASLFIRLGKLAEAGQLYEESLYHNRQLGDVEGAANSLYGLAIAAAARGDYQTARQLGEESLRLYGSLNHQFGMGWAYYCLGNILRDAQDFGEALARYQHSLRIWLEREDAVNAASVLEDLGLLLARQGQWLRLARLLGAAARFREDAHAMLTPYEESRRHNMLRACRAAIGEAAYEAAWAAGRALTLEQAAALARGID
ncbi:MAG TPA: BTAD domain-containing putative transcriptional regulator [Anaerolineae bacterium]|nr:BTAD domain-containing putative transcriptional regulator [Anaerolineae bacterium]